MITIENFNFSANESVKRLITDVPNILYFLEETLKWERASNPEFRSLVTFSFTQTNLSLQTSIAGVKAAFDIFLMGHSVNSV